jgi:formate dehydrogenase maturation protein FdhE
MILDDQDKFLDEEHCHEIRHAHLGICPCCGHEIDERLIYDDEETDGVLYVQFCTECNWESDKLYG